MEANKEGVESDAAGSKAEAEKEYADEKEQKCLLLKQENRENRESQKGPGEYAAGQMIEPEELERLGVPAFFYQQEITQEVMERINGISYPADCPIPLAQLRYLRMLYYGFDGNSHVGEMIVHAGIADDTLSVFQELFNQQYPIEKMVLIEEYGGEDEASMADNNTSAFHYRVIAGTSKLSNHSKGCAIDLNPRYNPYVKKKQNGGMEVSPVQAEPYVERSGDNPYYIRQGDTCVQVFKKYGFRWGGDWNTKKDYQHFEKDVY